MNKLLTAILLIVFGGALSASETDIKCDDVCYNSDVKTILLHPATDSLSLPIIAFGNMENQLRLAFDILGDEAYYLNYTFIHCTNDWRPSDLQTYEYRNGFDSENIDNYEFSVNTLTEYTHYELFFPTSGMMPVVSGNYLLIVFGDDLSPENILFTRRFMIAESVASITASVPRYPYDLSYGNTVQQIDLSVSLPDMFNNNIQRDMNVTIQQNGRRDNMIMGLKPSYVYPNSASFANLPQTIFGSGNLFRHFNTSSIRFVGENIKAIRQLRDCYQVVLQPDQKRASRPFSEYPTINGMRYVSIDRGRDSGVESDYCLVEFFLESERPVETGEVHVLGELTDWTLDESSRMTYDPIRKGYTVTLLLKQGYYNYAYAVLGDEEGNVGEVEGDYWETDNIYTIYVYLNDVIKGYDRLVGVNAIRSH